MTREQIKAIQEKFAAAQKSGQIEVSPNGTHWRTTDAALDGAINAAKVRP